MPDLIYLPKITDPRGNLSFIEEESNIPFKIKRIYWIYDVPGGFSRGGHAFRSTREFVVAISGSFDVVINDGNTERRIFLNRSYFGVYIPEISWRTLENFSTNSLALIVASTYYSESDYIRDYDDFLRIVKKK
jgi:hypothetical protein